MKRKRWHVSSFCSDEKITMNQHTIITKIQSFVEKELRKQLIEFARLPLQKDDNGVNPRFFDAALLFKGLKLLNCSSLKAKMLCQTVLVLIAIDCSRGSAAKRLSSVSIRRVSLPMLPISA